MYTYLSFFSPFFLILSTPIVKGRLGKKINIHKRVTHFKSVVILVLTAKGDPRAHAVNTAGKNKGQKKRQTVFFSGVKI